MNGSELARRLNSGKFCITAEVVPPLSADAGALLKLAEPLRGLATAVNVTDGASAKTTMSSFAAAAILVQHGIEPVLQVTCRDRNRIALAQDLIGAAAQGVHNLLALAGDDPKGGDQPDAKAVHDLKTVELIGLAARMTSTGKLPSDREIVPPPQLFVGAADVPQAYPRDGKPPGLIQKIEAGAGFVQTQLCWDLDLIRRYSESLVNWGLVGRAPVLIGMGPIASVRSAKWMRENLFGVSIPDAIIARMESAVDPKAEGRAICVELMRALKGIPGIAGVHLMAPGGTAEALAAVIREYNG